MDKEKLQEEVIAQIRACLISTKGACKLGQIRRDYEMLMGEDIPYARLGFKTLEQFVCSIPTLSTSRVNGQLLVDAKVMDKSAHISSFVQRQKTKKRSRAPPRQNFNRRQVAPPRWRPGNVTHNWNKSYETSPRPAAYAHKQVVSLAKSPQKSSTSNIKSRLGIKEESKLQFSIPHQQVRKHLQDALLEDTFTKQAKRRLSQKMADLSIVPDESSLLQAPEYMNSITIQPLDENKIKSIDSDFIQDVTVQKFKKSGDNWADLNVFASLHNLDMPNCKIITNKGKHRTLYYCKIQIGEHNYTSYPNDNFDEESAKQTAGSIALKDLEEIYQNKQPCLLISDNSDILKRIPPMVQEHAYGVWSSLIETNYSKQYNEELPKNWLEVLDSLSCIAVQQIHDKFVLNYCSSAEKTIYSNPNTTPNVSVPPNTVAFNDDGMLIAEITCISSAAEIWCAQRESPEMEPFFQMVKEMEDFYNSQGTDNKASYIQMGGHYVAWYDSMWCRVRVFEVNDDNIHCFCIDFGDEWIVQKDNLYNLKREFGVQPAQAFVCRLAGLEELYDISKTSEHLQTYLGTLVQVQEAIQTDDSETDSNDPVLPVVCYDLDTGEPLNERIITYISMEIASASLVVNSPTEVYVTHALDDGTLYIQIRSIGYEHLMSLIEKAGQNVLENRSSITPVKVSKDKSDELYFIQHKEDGLWYRTKIIDWPPKTNRYCQIMFVDNGKTGVVEVESTEFYALRDISDVIIKFPIQGILVKLLLKTIPSDFVKRIAELMPPDEAVVVKSVKMDSNYLPIVEFFKRSEKDNILFSVNTAFTADNGLKNAGGDGNNNHKPQSNKLQRLISLNQFEDVSSKNVPSTGSLSCPFIPEVGNFFDVKVPCAVHPHNFFVQPYESQEELNRLMVTLQERYKNSQHSSIPLNEILPGKIYASKHTDNKWYRTSVIKVINSGSISVFYCDFGYYGTLTVQQLFSLDNEFMKLPYQAIKAKLADIKPKNLKWSMEDCNFFWKLVSKKSFVSILKSIEKDVLYQSDIVLSLKLIDTSQNEDIYIDQVLINEGKAINSI